MLDHVSISVSDMARAERFYDAVMAALAVMKVGSSETWIGYGERCDATHPDRAYLSIRLGPRPERAERCRTPNLKRGNLPMVLTVPRKMVQASQGPGSNNRSPYDPSMLQAGAKTRINIQSVIAVTA